MCLQNGAAALPKSAGAVMTDSSVPEGHRGLHGFLYGESGAEVHEEADRDYQAREVRGNRVSLHIAGNFLHRHIQTRGHPVTLAFRALQSMYQSSLLQYAHLHVP